MNTEKIQHKTAQGKPELPVDKSKGLWSLNPKEREISIEQGATLGELLAKHQPQGQHSPLPWSISNDGVIHNGNTQIARIIRSDDYESDDEANAKLIVASVNNAQALAEALRECRIALTLNYHGCTKPKKALCDVSAAASQAHNKAVLALANWEAAKS